MDDLEHAHDDRLGNPDNPSNPEWAINFGLTKARESREPRVHISLDAPLTGESGAVATAITAEWERLLQAAGQYTANKVAEANERDEEREAERKRRKRSAVVNNGAVSPPPTYHPRRGRGGHEFQKR